MARYLEKLVHNRRLGFDGSRRKLTKVHVRSNSPSVRRRLIRGLPWVEADVWLDVVSYRDLRVAFSLWATA